MVIIVTWFIDSRLLESRSPWLDKAYILLEAMISNGNRIAEFRMGELQRLDEMLTEYSAGQAQPSSTFGAPQSDINVQQPIFDPSLPEDCHATSSVLPGQDNLSTYAGVSDESSGYGDDLTAEQILAAAESMDLEGTDWLSFATMENIQLMDTQGI